MNGAFLAMIAASFAHVIEEYILPGGFLQWLQICFPGSRLTKTEAWLINGVFLGFVVSPLGSMPRQTPILYLSLPCLLIANGALHVIGTFTTRLYSPGVVTAVFGYFPAAIYALFTLAAGWHMSPAAVLQAAALGIAFQLLPLTRLLLMRRRS